MEALRASIRASQAQFIKDNPTHGGHPDFKDVITTEDVETVLNYTINWGKYKGMTYKEILIRYPAYFNKTVLGFQMKHPTSYTWRCFAKLLNMKDPNDLNYDGKSVQRAAAEPELGPPLPLKRQ
jgi:hypothetical protein